MIKRSGVGRKSNIKERRFEIAGQPNGGFKPPLLEAFEAPNVL